MKEHIWIRGDKVVITGGRHAGREGVVLRVIAEGLVVDITDTKLFESHKLTVVKPNDLILVTNTYR